MYDIKLYYAIVLQKIGTKTVTVATFAPYLPLKGAY